MKKKHVVLWCVLLFTLLFLIAGLIFAKRYYTVTNVEVEGNVHYTDDEIVHMVLSNALTGNSLYLAWLYDGAALSAHPFIERIDVDILTRDTVRMTVYEKSVAGCIAWLGKYVYFDRDGTVVEISNVVTQGIPVVLGLNVEYCVLYEKLPVSDDAVFDKILTITQLLEKYDIRADSIFFDASYGVHLVIGFVEAEIGQNEALEEVFSRIAEVLPSLAGKHGILRMKDYGGAGEDVTFEESRINQGSVPDPP